MNSFLSNKIYSEKTVKLLMLISLMAIFIFWLTIVNQSPSYPLANNTPIKVGVLHSLSGTIPSNELAVSNATLLAIEQINAAGGLLGRTIEASIVDGQSSDAVFEQEARRLIREENVSALFACWTSACRKTLKPIVETYNTLMFYPLHYEGIEASKNIIYTGSTPNQQITASLHWLIKNLGKKIYLIGSDSIFPRIANAIIRDYVNALNAEIVGETYLPLGSSDVVDALDQINRLKPDIILNTINGDSNFAFFEALYALENNHHSRFFPKVLIIWIHINKAFRC